MIFIHYLLFASLHNVQLHTTSFGNVNCLPSALEYARRISSVRDNVGASAADAGIGLLRRCLQRCRTDAFAF
jgi:hypothetical protein